MFQNLVCLLSVAELVLINVKFNGLEPPLEWTVSKREPASKTVNVTNQFVQFSRLKSGHHGLWQYDTWGPDRLCFSVSKNALFHGVYLFGNSSGGIYNVILEVKGVKDTEKFSYSTSNHGKVFILQIMLESPIVIKANEIVTLTARINGPASFMRSNGITTVEHYGVTVTRAVAIYSCYARQISFEISCF